MSSPQEQAFTLEDALFSIGVGCFQIRLLILLLGFHMADAMETMFLSIISSSLKCEWNSPSWIIALTSTVVFLGTTVASPVWGRFSDVYGRRKILFMSSIWVAYFGLLSAFSPSIIWFLILRFLTGAGFPGSYLAFVILSEFVPKTHKAWMLILYQLSWPIGCCIETGLAGIILPTMSWRILVGVTSIPVFITAFLTKFVPESPEYSLVSGKQEKVMKLLHSMSKVNKGKVPEGKLIPGFQKHRGQLKDLFGTKTLSHVTLHFWLLTFSQSFIYYGLVLLFSEMQRKNYTSCLQSKGDVFVEKLCQCEKQSWNHYIPDLITSSGEFVSCVLNFLFLDWFGRKKTIAFHFVWLGILILLLYACISDTSRAVIIFFIRAFSQAVYTALTIFVTEVYPAEIRSIGYGLSITTLRMGAVVTPFVSQVLSEYSFSLTIGIYGILALICGISLIIFPVESKPSKNFAFCQQFEQKQNL